MQQFLEFQIWHYLLYNMLILSLTNYSICLKLKMDNFTKFHNKLYQHQTMQSSYQGSILSSKRDNYRIKIRNDELKIKRSQKRQSILKTLKSISLHILNYLEMIKQNIPVSQLDVLIYQLQQGYDDPEFYRKLSQLKLQKVLLTYLTKLILIKPKVSLITSLNQLLYYSNQSIQIFIQENAIDFLYKELKNYSFLDQEENEYLDGVLKLIRNLTSVLNKQFNLYLQDIEFLQMVTKKILKEGGGRNLGNTIYNKEREILKIRTNLILTLNRTLNINKQKMLKESLRELYEQNILYSRHYTSYIQCLIAIFQIKEKSNQNEKNMKRSLFNDIQCLALQNIPHSYFDPQRLNEEEIILLFKLLIIMYENYRDELLHISFFLDKQFFIGCLNRFDRVCFYAMKMLKVHNFLKKIQLIFDMNGIEDKTQFYIFIIQSICEKINYRDFQNYSIDILHKILFQLDNNPLYGQIMQKNNLLQKCEELLQKENQTTDKIIQILQITQNIIDYILKKQNNNWILEILNSRGFPKIIESLQFHDSNQISELASKISEKYNFKSAEI